MLVCLSFRIVRGDVVAYEAFDVREGVVAGCLLGDLWVKGLGQKLQMISVSEIQHLAVHKAQLCYDSCDGDE